jgi:hypothetical protein
VIGIFLKDQGQAPTGSYIDRDGLYWPADFHTWNMVTAYYNLELAFDYFQALGLSASSLGQVTAYYWPTFIQVQQGSSAQIDDLLFFSPVQAMLLLPFDNQLSLVPLQMNSGVIAHEYAHRIFNLGVYRGELFPSPLGQSGNMLMSLDEGLADFHAYVATCKTTVYGCNARFLEASLGSAAADARDITKTDKCMSSDLATSLCTTPSAQFIAAGQHFKVGAILGAALYHASTITGQRDVLATSLLNAYSDTTPSTRGFQQLLYDNPTTNTVTLGAAANIILNHITDPNLKRVACNQLMTWVQLTSAEICPTGTTTCGCPATSAPGPECPNMNVAGTSFCF